MGREEEPHGPLPSPSFLNQMHADNRAKFHRAMVLELKSLDLPISGIVLLQGGEEETRYCTDHVPLFRQESYFAYLFGVREPGFYGAIDVSTGKSILFAPRLNPEYAVWLGKIHTPSFFKERYEVDSAFYVDEIVETLQRLSSGSDKVLYLLHGLNTDSNKYSSPACFPGIDKFKVQSDILHSVLSECRVRKSSLEIELLRYVNKVSSAAHVEVMRIAMPGLKEYQLESSFLHYSYMNGGCRYASYTCICATGGNSSVLHYGHAAAPNDRTLRDGDMALLDMGAEYNFYGSDITCSFPVNGKFTQNQRIIYGAVLAAQKSVIMAIKPGVNWVDMHKLAEEKILEGLKDAGCLKGEVEEMVQKRLGATFMPHGLGHFLGLDTHDPGGYPKGVNRLEENGLKSLRTVRVLEEGMVITVEPGCYFIDPLLDAAFEDSTLSKFMIKKGIEEYKGMGGIRLEDDVVVTGSGCENLTNCPREIEEVEAVMAGGTWQNSDGWNSVRQRQFGFLYKSTERTYQEEECEMSFNAGECKWRDKWDPWAPGTSVDSQSVASQLFSLFPY